MQHKPLWDRYVLFSKMKIFKRNDMIRITKLQVSMSRFYVKTPRKSKNFKFKIGKIQVDFYKFLIKGVGSTVYNKQYT
jgi:hypothetical protein